MKKNPSTLVSQEKLNPTQRKSIGAGVYEGPRVRDPDEALPITFRVSKLKTAVIPVMTAPRASSMAFMAIKSRGVHC
jgi:hypothetical protein